MDIKVDWEVGIGFLKSSVVSVCKIKPLPMFVHLYFYSVSVKSRCSPLLQCVNKPRYKSWTCLSIDMSDMGES